MEPGLALVLSVIYAGQVGSAQPYLTAAATSSCAVDDAAVLTVRGYGRPATPSTVTWLSPHPPGRLQSAGAVAGGSMHGTMLGCGRGPTTARRQGVLRRRQPAAPLRSDGKYTSRPNEPEACWGPGGTPPPRFPADRAPHRVLLVAMATGPRDISQTPGGTKTAGPRHYRGRQHPGRRGGQPGYGQISNCFHYSRQIWNPPGVTTFPALPGHLRKSPFRT